MQAVPTSVFSSRYIVSEDGATVADVQHASLRERATVRIGDRSLELTRLGLVRGSLVLMEHGVEIAQAERAGAMSRVWHLRSASGSCDLTKPSWWSRAYELRSEGRTVGSIQPEGFLRRGAIADLPSGMAIEFRVFVLVVVLTLWRREDSAAAGGGS
ncbi:MAG: hypothetical protein ACRD0K_15955 [Egibacteraceae bacterium]